MAESPGQDRRIKVLALRVADDFVQRPVANSSPTEIGDGRAYIFDKRVVVVRLQRARGLQNGCDLIWG